MPGHDLQKALQPLPPMLNHIITEPVGEYLPRQWGDRHPRALSFQDVAEDFEVGVAAAHDRVAQLEGRDVRVQHDLVGGVHAAGGGAVGLRVADL